MQSVEHLCSIFYTISTDSVLARFLCISRASCLYSNKREDNNYSIIEACSQRTSDGSRSRALKKYFRNCICFRNYFYDRPQYISSCVDIDKIKHNHQYRGSHEMPERGNRLVMAAWSLPGHGTKVIVQDLQIVYFSSRLTLQIHHKLQIMKVEAELLKTRIITKRPSLRPFSGFVRQAIPVCR